MCAAFLTSFWREYEFHPWRRPLFTLAIALVVFALWIGPQQFLHFPARTAGFNPDTLAHDPPLYWAILALRFIRLVVVGPLVEEIFWRSLLLR